MTVVRFSLIPPLPPPTHGSGLKFYKDFPKTLRTPVDDKDLKILESPPFSGTHDNTKSKPDKEWQLIDIHIKTTDEFNVLKARLIEERWSIDEDGKRQSELPPS